MKRRIVIGLLCVVLIVTVGVVWSNARTSQAVDTAAGSPASEESAEARIPVVAEPLAYRDIERFVTYYGVLQPRTTVQLTMQVGGRVQELPLDVGDAVSVGDVLLRLDTVELEAQVRQAEAGLAIAKANLERMLSGATADELAQARAAVEQAEVQFENTQVEYNRTERLYQSGSVSRQAFDSAESQLQIAKTQLDSALARLSQVQRGAAPEDIASAEAQVKQAQASLDLSAAQLEKAVLRAPVSGVISRRSIEIGETVSPGAPVFTVVDLSELALHIKALGQDVIRIEAGMPVRVVVEDDPALSFVGRLHRVEPVADPQSNLFPVEVRLPNDDEQLRAGFYASAKIMVASAKDALAVPERAVARRDGQEGLYVVKDGRAIFVPTHFGMSDGRAWREVIAGEGLGEGVLVITAGKEYVTHDVPVKVQGQ